MTLRPIDRLDCWILRIPTIRAHTLSVATMREQRLVLLRLTDRDGMTGWGEATTIGNLAYTDESPDSIKLHLDLYFREFLIGQLPEPEPLMAAVGKAIVGNYFAKCAVETALYDLKGRQTGCSIADMLGSNPKHKSLPVAWTLASGDTDRDIEEGRQMLAARRHKIFKLKIGKRRWQDDVRHAAAIAEALGQDASIRVDVNQAWSFSDAKQAIPALAEAGVTLVEQPVAATDLDGARELCGLSGAVIMADEALRGGVAAADLVIRHRAADVLSLKIAQAGGLTSCRQVAERGQKAGLALYGGTMLEGGIGTAASAHVFATLPDFQWGTELFGPLLLTEEILQEPLAYDDFCLRLPQGDGLGVTVDEAAIREFAETGPS